MPEEDKNSSSALEHAIAQITIETARDVRAFLGKLFGSAAAEFGAMLGDQMRYWRFRNFLRILSKAEEITKARGYELDGLSSLGFGDAFRTIEAASYEEEDEIQDLWARLIANAVSPNSKVTIKKIYIDLLKSLSPAEAAFLELLAECEKKARWGNVDEISEFNTRMNQLADLKWRKYAVDTRRSATQNLVRTRCIAFRPRPLNIDRLFGEIPREMIGSSFEKWALVDPKKFQDLITHLSDMMLTATGVKEFDASKPIRLQSGYVLLGGKPLSLEVPEMNFMLTALGNDLVKACENESAHVGGSVPG